MTNVCLIGSIVAWCIPLVCAHIQCAITAEWILTVCDSEWCRPPVKSHTEVWWGSDIPCTIYSGVCVFMCW